MSIHEQWMTIFPTKWRAKGRNKVGVGSHQPVKQGVWIMQDEGYVLVDWNPGWQDTNWIQLDMRFVVCRSQKYQVGALAFCYGGMAKWGVGGLQEVLPGQQLSNLLDILLEISVLFDLNNIGCVF